MDDPLATLSLWDYRRRVEAIYAEARRAGAGRAAWDAWREAREELFRSHPQSAVPEDQRERFGGLEYYPYDPTWRYQVEVHAVPGSEAALAHNNEQTTWFRRFGSVRFEHAAETITLMLFWLEGYGGGVFLPFRDPTNGSETYGGGRYLLDTAKGADLGHDRNRVILDFNYAYHPSCVYDPRWSCPLAPSDNVMRTPVRAGERLPAGQNQQRGAVSSGR